MAKRSLNLLRVVLGIALFVGGLSYLILTITPSLALLFLTLGALVVGVYIGKKLKLI